MTSSFFMEFFLTDMCESVLNVLNRSPYQNTNDLIFINFEQLIVKL